MLPAEPADPPSGLAVPIRIPPSLARVRRRWDRAAIAGARAHVTVLYPFLPTSRLTPDVRAQLAAIARSVSPFEVRFARVRRFDDGVVWVAPEPATPFQELT
ncbi:MAG: 2'-5' RNA ligase family protein, partial [Candidatus Limnocylindrales bacterium]